MQKKSRLVRRSLGEGGSARARRSVSTRRLLTNAFRNSPAIAGRKVVGEGGFFNLRGLIGLLFCAATAYFILIPIRSGLAFLRPQAPSNASHPAAAGLT